MRIIPNSKSVGATIKRGVSGGNGAGWRIAASRMMWLGTLKFVTPVKSLNSGGRLDTGNGRSHFLVDGLDL